MLRQYYGIIGASVALVIHFIASFTPYAIIDNLYTNGLYIIIKWILLPFQWVPFPALWLWALLIISLLILWFYKGWRPRKKVGLKIISLINCLGWLIALFYLFWAWNYRASPIKEQLNLKQLTVDSNDIKDLFEKVTADLILTRKNCKIERLNSEHDLVILQDQIIIHEKEFLTTYGFPTKVPAKVKYLPKGFLLRISTAGFYMPLAGEGYIDKGLHPIVVPHVLAHELAHNYGVTDEGEANFIALRTCLASQEAHIRYSGLLDLWRYLSYTMRKINPNHFTKTMEHVPNSIKNDLKDIRTQHNLYPDILPDVRDFIYDGYLKSQGVQSGLTSYSEVILLELAYRQQSQSN